jgi:hypothetical protein
MRNIITFLILVCCTIKAEVNEITNFKLDPRLIHTVYCHERDTGVTTVLFPSEISGAYSARVDVKFNEKKPTPYLLSFSPGNAHFTIKSLAAAGTKGAVNVIYEKKVYVIHLETLKRGHSSVSFIRPKRPLATVGNNGKMNMAPSPALLLSMLDKAKAYHLFKKHYPAQIEELDYHASSTVMDYSTHQILLKEVIRFQGKDTIYFHLQIKNKGKQKLRYSPKGFGVTIGDEILYCTLADASGVVPASGVTSAWFCISGNKSGGRNNLAAKNDWKILLNVSQMPHIPTKPLAIKEEKNAPSVKEKP